MYHYQSKVAGSVFVLSIICLLVPAHADTFSFSTGSPNGLMASTSGSPGVESADDFVTTGAQTSLTSATFTGLLTGGATARNVTAVGVEIYRVFPKDSDVGRTPQVPTRVNSPSDVEFVGRSTTSGNLSFNTTTLASSFSTLNSVQPGAIHVNSGGSGSVTGLEVQFSVNFTVPIDLSPDHYFFVPQVELTGVNNGEFLWLSAARSNPLFPSGFPDLQSWMRDQALDPDWLRIGTDIIGGTTPPTFNASFSLNGVVTPLPGALPLFATGLGVLGMLGWRRKKKGLLR